MFRLRFWTLLLSLSALVIAAGEARFAMYRARELRLNPPIISVAHPSAGGGARMAAIREASGPRGQRGARRGRMH